MTGSTISLPNLPAYVTEAFNIPNETNPHYSEVEAASYEWFNSYGIFTDDKRQMFLDFKFDLMAALCFPDTDASRFRTIVDFTLCYFSFQVMVDSELKSPEKMRSAIDAIMRAANDPSASSSNFPPAAMIQSCLQRIEKDGPPLVVQRLVAGLDEYTRARFEEKFNRSTVPTPEESIELKRDVGGMKLWDTMYQYAHNLDLPEEVINHQCVSELTKTGTDVFNLVNDICSVPRVVQGDHPHNIISAVMYHNSDLDLKDSIDHVDKMLRGRLDKFLDIKAELPSFGPGVDEQVSQHARNIEHAIHGLVEWAFRTPLYFRDQAESVRKTGVVNLDMVAPM